jgi:adenylate cyclase
VVINSFLGIPLLINDRLIGTLTLVHHEPGFFTENDMRQLNKLAAQASVAIDNAIQVRQRENLLKAQIRELRVEIDQAKLTQQVEEITTTDYFKQLQSNAARMRERVYTRDRSRKPSEDANE